MLQALFAKIKKNRWNIGPPLLFLLLIIVGYATAFNAPFLVDDKATILNNSDIGSLTHLFSSPVAVFVYLPNFISYKIGGLTPIYYRIFNLLFHFGTATMLYFIVKQLFNPRAALITSILFSIHPILIESVTWISALPYVKYSFFLMFTLLAYIYGKQSKKWYWISIVSALLAILSSEKAVVLPAVIILLECTFFSLKQNWKKIMPHVFVVGSIAFTYVLNIGARIDSFQKDYYISKQFYNPVEHLPYAITYYLQLIFFPKDLTIYHSELSISITEFLIRWLIFIVFVVSLIIFRKKSKAFFFWSSFFVIAISPTLLPLNIVWVVAERYVYLGTVGVIAVFGYGISKLIDMKKYQTITYAVLALIVVTLLGRTIVRNGDWISDVNLWSATIAVSPHSSNAHNNMGDVYANRGDYKNAALEFQRAIELQPGDADPRHNLGIALTILKRYPEAVAAYEGALSIDSTLYKSHQNLGLVYYSLKNYEKAEEHLAKALQFGPPNSTLTDLLKEVRELIGR